MEKCPRNLVGFGIKKEMIMYENWTDGARAVMDGARDEAMVLNHEYIAPEHILLGVAWYWRIFPDIAEKEVGIKLLKNSGIEPLAIRGRMVRLLKAGPEMVSMGKLPRTPRAMAVIAFAIEEARILGHQILGIEHLILGILRQQDSVATQALRDAWASVHTTPLFSPDLVRQVILRLRSEEPQAGGVRVVRMGGEPPAALRTAPDGSPSPDQPAPKPTDGAPEETEPRPQRIHVVGLCQSYIQNADALMLDPSVPPAIKAQVIATNALTLAVLRLSGITVLLKS